MIESTGLRTLVVLVGIAGALWFVSSAVRSLVIPRPERVWLTSALFAGARRVAIVVANRFSDPDRRHRALGAFAPTVLISLPLVWSLGLIASFAAIFWGLGGGELSDAIGLSGSSLTTLGFVPATTFVQRMVAIVEGLLGLAIVALVISFLPTLYATFSRREVAVGRLTVRSGQPPSPVEFIVRLNLINGLHDVDRRWEQWEQWFTEIAETHTSFPALVHFRSAERQRSWITAAESALDTAALMEALQLAPDSVHAPTMIRAGYLSLRAIADHYDIEPELEPDDRESLSIDREMYDRLHDALVEQGVPISVSKDDGWHHYSGWRINYDRSVLGLSTLVHEVPSHWSEDHG
ncbi:MAG: hypothetical protein ACR2P0_02955 [Acidimicrobiales bacterium]